MNSPKFCVHGSSDLADLHDAALGRRLHRRLGQDQGAAPVLEPDLGRLALLDRVDEGADLGVEGLAVALDEEVEIGRARFR